VLFALPVPVTSAINPIFAQATMLLIANHMVIVSHAIQLLPLNFMKWVGQTAGYSPHCFLFCPSSILIFRAPFCHVGERYP